MIANQVICCDALDLISSTPSRSAGAIITDPPFTLSADVDPWEPRISTVEEALRGASPVTRHSYRVLRPGGALVVMGQQLLPWDIAAIDAGFRLMADITVLWDTGVPRNRNFASLSMPVRWYVKPGGRYSFNADGQRQVFSNVIVCRKIAAEDRIHPSQKPVELTNFLVSLLTNSGDTVIDPFMGSGSTLVSAALCGRVWIGCDKREEYIDIAERRAQNPEFEGLDPLYLWYNNRLVSVEG